MLRKLGKLPALALVLFTFVYQFGMFNILTSMFVDRTMKIQSKDREAKIFEQRCREAEQTKVRILKRHPTPPHESLVNISGGGHGIEN